MTVALDPRYAPYRDGKVQGEERSLVADVLSKADTGAVEFRGTVTMLAGSETRKFQLASDGSRESKSPQPGRIDRKKGQLHLSIGPLGSEPAVARIEGTVEDRFGLTSPISVLAANYRVMDPLRWIEGTTGLSVDRLSRKLHRLEDGGAPPTDARLATIGMLRALVDVLQRLEREPSAAAASVAGALRLAEAVLPRIAASTRTR
jgi:hypothetical protein